MKKLYHVKHNFNVETIFVSNDCHTYDLRERAGNWLEKEISGRDKYNLIITEIKCVKDIPPTRSCLCERIFF